MIVLYNNRIKKENGHVNIKQTDKQRKNNFIEVDKTVSYLNNNNYRKESLWFTVLTDLSDHICGNNYIPVVYR